MANMTIAYTIAKHAVANPSNVLAAEGGEHIFNIKLATECDNGNLVKRGDWVEYDVFAEGAVTTFEGKVVEQMPNGNWLVLVTNPGDACLVYQAPIAAEEWTEAWKKESNMFNPANAIVRAYRLHEGDRFEVSAEGFSATPEVGKGISGVASKKMTLAS